jgi:uncharacterized protein
MKPMMTLVCTLLLGTLHAAAQSPTSKPAAPQTGSAEGGSSVSSSTKEKPIDPSKAQDIRRLQELIGSKERMAQVMNEMEKTMRPLMNNALPAGDYREKLVEAFFVKFHSKLDLQQFLDQAMPIYDRQFSHEEIKGLIQFYQTPLGQKYLSAVPQITAEMMAQGQKWGQDLGRKSILEVLAEHPEYEKQMEEAQRTSQAH